MKKSFAVLGLGRFGLKLVEELSHHKVEVIACDSDEESVKKASEFTANAFICDVTNEKALKELGVNNVDHAIITIGSNLQSTIIATIIMKEFNVKEITVRVDDDYFIPAIKKLGATDIVSPQKLAGIRLANIIVSDTFLDYYNIGNEFCIVECVINPNAKKVSIIDLNARNEYGVNILMIKRHNKIILPKGSDFIEPNDQIYVFGHKDNITTFEHVLNVKR